MYVLDRLAGRFQYEILMFQNNLYPSRKIDRSLPGLWLALFWDGKDDHNDWLVLSKIFYVPFQILG